MSGHCARMISGSIGSAAASAAICATQLLGRPEERLGQRHLAEALVQLRDVAGVQCAPRVDQEPVLGHRLEAREGVVDGATGHDLAADRVARDAEAQAPALVLPRGQQLGDLGHAQLGGDRPRVAQPRRAQHPRAAHRADPQRRARLLPRPHVRAGTLDGPEAAVERDLVVGPQARDQVERLLEHRVAPPVVQPEGCELVGAVAGSGADDQPAAAEEVQRREVLGQRDRVEQRHLHDERGEAARPARSSPASRASVGTGCSQRYSP